MLVLATTRIEYDGSLRYQTVCFSLTKKFYSPITRAARRFHRQRKISCRISSPHTVLLRVVHPRFSVEWVQAFFETFIATDAEKGLASFHESIGDTEVQATEWKVSGGALGMTREIRFVHPVKAPIGPNRTRAVKLQR